MIRRRRGNLGVTVTEYGIIISLLSATAWAVFATWRIWGWGVDLESSAGQGYAQLRDDLGIDEAFNGSPADPDVGDDAPGGAPPPASPPDPGPEPEPEPAEPPPPPPPPPPAVANDGGELTVTNVTTKTKVNVRYMGANAGLAAYSSCWMRIRSTDGTVTDVQLTNDNTGAARTIVSNHVLQEGDRISFFEKIKPKSWSNTYYNFQRNAGRLTGTGTSAYYNVFSTESDGPNQVTRVTNYAAGAAGNIFGHDEYHIGFEDLALDWGGCDRDYNDAEIRVSIFDVVDSGV